MEILAELRLGLIRELTFDFDKKIEPCKAKEVAVLNNYLKEAHMTKGRGNHLIMLSKPKAGFNDNKCIGIFWSA